MKMPSIKFVFLVLASIYLPTVFSTVDYKKFNILCLAFKLSNNPNITQACKNQMFTLCENPDLLWRFFDASSKYPFPGLSFGANMDLGNYPECVRTKFTDDDGTIKGKYCTFSVALPNLFFNSTGDGDVIPQYSLLSTCVPDACRPKDFGLFLNLDLPIFLDGVESRCVTSDSNSTLSPESVILVCFLVFILVLVLLSTAYDIKLYIYEEKCPRKVLLAFSALTNTRNLIKLPLKSADQITCLNGLRFISMLWIIAYHGFTLWQGVDIINIGDGLNFVNSWGSQYISSARIAVDTFFFISGVVMTYSYLKQCDKVTLRELIVQTPKTYLHRYLRLTPAMLVIFLVTITFFRNMGSGPMWNTLMDLLVETNCKTYWYSFLFYFQNYNNPNALCLDQTWYLSADMQMFILAPIVLIPMTVLIKRHFKAVVYGVCALTAFCTVLSIIIGFNAPHNDEYDTHARLSSFLIGMILGAVLREKKNSKFPFNQVTNVTLWILVLIVSLLFNSYYHSVVAQPGDTKGVLFYNLYRPLWASCLFWLVYSCHYGYGGVINYFLSLPFFQIGARLTYSMYLLHGSVIVYWAANLKTLQYFSNFDVYYVYWGHLVTTSLFAYIWVICFESPVIILEKWFFEKKPPKT